MSLTPPDEEDVIVDLAESSSSAPSSIIPVFATMRKGISSASMSSSRSGSAHSGSTTNLTGSHGAGGAGTNTVGDSRGGHNVKKTRLATMCPTVPGHIVPPKSQTSTPRQSNYRTPTASVIQRNAHRVQTTNSTNVNTSSRPSSAIPTATGQGIGGGSRANSAGTQRDGRGFSNISSISKPGVKNNLTLLPNPKSSSSSSSSASSLTIQQSQQPGHLITTSSKIQSSIIDELEGQPRPVKNGNHLYQRANSHKTESSSVGASKLTRLRKTQRSNSTTSVNPVIPVKNQKNQPSLDVPPPIRRRVHSSANATSNITPIESSHQSSKVKNGTTMTSSISNHHISSTSNLHQNNNNGVPTSHSMEALKHAAGTTNGNSGVTTRSKNLRVSAKNEEILRTTLADIERERANHAEETARLLTQHETEINEINSKCEEQLNSVKSSHQQQVKELKQNHGFDIDKVKRVLTREITAKNERVEQLETRLEGLTLEVERERECHREEIQSLISKQEQELKCLNERIDALKQSHELQLEEITKNRQSQVEHLEKDHRTKIESLKRKHREQLDQQSKQIPDNILKKEIESLEVVLQLKNKEIKDMRKELLEFKTKNEELSFLYDQNKLMHAKVEDLEAQIAKTRTDKNSILEKFNVMETSMHQMINENDRLHLNNEQLSYKIELLQTSDHSLALSETPEGSFTPSCQRRSRLRDISSATSVK